MRAKTKPSKPKAKEQRCLKEFRRLLEDGNSYKAKRLYYDFHNGNSWDLYLRAPYCAAGHDAIRDFCWSKEYEKAERIARVFEDWTFVTYLKMFHPRYAKQNLNKAGRRN